MKKTSRGTSKKDSGKPRHESLETLHKRAVRYVTDYTLDKLLVEQKDWAELITSQQAKATELKASIDGFKPDQNKDELSKLTQNFDKVSDAVSKLQKAVEKSQKAFHKVEEEVSEKLTQRLPKAENVEASSKDIFALVDKKHKEIIANLSACNKVFGEINASIRTCKETLQRSKVKLITLTVNPKLEDTVECQGSVNRSLEEECQAIASLYAANAERPGTPERAATRALLTQMQIAQRRAASLLESAFANIAARFPEDAAKFAQDEEHKSSAKNAIK